MSVDALLESLTLEEKVGQVLMVGMEETYLSPALKARLERFHVGNVIFLGRNYVDPRQMRAFTDDLQRLAAARRTPIGFLTAIDQEGGVVARLVRGGTTVFPGNMALGAVGDPELARAASRVMAEEMRALGLNMNLAPVLDVNNNPANPGIGVRSYGEDPALAARLGAAAIEGTQGAGVMATAKHFPGKGDVTIDSHLDLPTVPHSVERLNRVELVPFRAAIEAGVGAIMTAHVFFPAYEPEPLLPATLSRNVLTGLLRDELGFEGVIITDDLFMGAISKRFGLGEAGIMAINAGADIVLMCHDPGEQEKAIGEILTAAREGRIARERLDSAVRRVLEAKARFGLLEPEISDGTAPKVGSPASRKLALDIARRSIALVRNADGLIPFDVEGRGNVLVVCVDVSSLTMVEDAQLGASPLARAVRTLVPSAEETRVSQSPGEKEIRDTVESASGRDLVIVGTYNGHLYPAQAELVKALAEVGPPVVVAMRNPYDIAGFPEIGTYVAAFGFRDCSMQAAAEVVFGKVDPVGTLPVTIPGLK
ncbi:MAG: beta-N-acetylhexosaminidase [Bacillota bacterium]|jgi:beta-N-acetylhexosaminidase|nr:beta-N-acetylhexosaminidase [Bacillota bacterium]